MINGCHRMLQQQILCLTLEKKNLKFVFFLVSNLIKTLI